MTKCAFTRQDFDELARLMTRDECEPRDSHERCRTYDAPNRDYCLDACNLVQKYGNGFSFYDLMLKINARTNKRFTSCFPSDRYGSGAMGIVLRVTCSTRDNDFTHYALKLTKFKTPRGETPYDFINETNMQEKFHRMGLAPSMLFSRIYHRQGCSNTVGIIVMEPIDYTFADIISRTDRVLGDRGSTSVEKNDAKAQRKRHSSDINDMVQRMKRYSLTHGDMHSQNIAFLRDKMVLIDFGRSTGIYSNPILDIAAAASSDIYMSSYLANEIAATNIPGKGELYDKKFLDLLLGNLVCHRGVHDREPSAMVSNLMRYKFFISQVIPHLSLMEGVYKTMKVDNELSNALYNRDVEEGEITTKRRRF